jgi:hypothetical protein
MLGHRNRKMWIMANTDRNSDILRDIMTRPDARTRQRADMGDAEGISFTMGRTLPDEERAHPGPSNTGPSATSDVDHGPYR